VTENRYLKGFSLITNMAQLKLLCPPPKGGKGIAPDMRPEPIIASHVEKLLRKSELDFLTGFYVPETMQFRARTKSEASRLYYIRRKLNFESSSELKQLMLYLSHHKAISAQTQKERTDDRLVRAAWPILRTLVTL
jgi:hypothetical protein